MKTIQTFPALNIQALENGLLRLEDPTPLDGPCTLDLHPVQVQMLALMAGFSLPDTAAKSLARLASRLEALKKQAADLESQLRDDLLKHDMDVPVELTFAEFIAHGLDEAVKDVVELRAPRMEPVAGAENAGGQLSLPIA